jgi:hypothetical protein
LEQALDLKTTIIYDVIQNGDRQERVVNRKATLAGHEFTLHHLSRPPDLDLNGLT